MPEKAAWHPSLAHAFASLPSGRTALWGVPFDLADDRGRLWLDPDGPVREVVVNRKAGYLVIAHVAAPSRTDVAVGAPDGRPSGIAGHPGEPIASYTIRYGDGSTWAIPIRRRFEIGDVVTAWGQLPFLARPHLGIRALDPDGSHGAGTWGRHLMSAELIDYSYPQGRGSPDGPAGNLWLYAMRNPRPDEQVIAVTFEAVGDVPIAIIGLTLYSGHTDPLYRGPLESLRIDGHVAPGSVDVDLGTIGRIIALPERVEQTPGWGGVIRGERKGVIVELCAAEEAELMVGGLRVPLLGLREHRQMEFADGGTRIRLLPAADRLVEVTVWSDGDPTPCRVSFVAEDGRYLAPEGHRQTVSSDWFQTEGADLVLGHTNYAYVPGRFDVRLPIGSISVEVAKGFEHATESTTLKVAEDTARFDITLDRISNLRAEGWISGDTHVHFLSPHTAALEARAEGIQVVNLLASQWGDLFTNIGDITGSPAIAHEDVTVWVGTEDRQHMLGHLSMLGTQGGLPSPVSTGGPDESRIGDAVLAGLGQWADWARARGGLAVIPHFPMPLAEAVASIILDKVDAVELRDFWWSADSHAVREWYRLLNCGLRIPAVGGTDKMTAAMPLGGVRTYAHTGSSNVSFASWADAIRGGRTFTSSGPLLTFSIDGLEPGDEISIGHDVVADVEARAVSSLPLSSLEVVNNGTVVARVDRADTYGGRGHAIRLHERIRLRSGWAVARASGDSVAWHEWPVVFAAHTSPIYIGKASAQRPKEADLVYLDGILAGGASWLETLAPRSPRDARAEVARSFVDARAWLAARRQGRDGHED